ncbi:uncharacterized protein E0L32_009597 [Thyridium curvatum]|uniref:Transmembrane protein 14C n=1 Tax=Thyridium curvatum TaxID=1093900 RepID=A0A507AMI8_9PEZI|nr:uncharacterized protein E0L32_009597 [Thyridium curvatum]TPX08893.1 hypothetical protein E0L32_009597 [Thyridium curvatum]
MASQSLDTSSYVLAALTASGGIAGYARTGSVPSIVAGCTVGLLCCASVGTAKANRYTPPSDGLGGYRIQNRQPYGVELSLLASVILGGSSIPRAIRLRKPVPIFLAILSTFGILTFGNAFRRSL